MILISVVGTVSFIVGVLGTYMFTRKGANESVRNSEQTHETEINNNFKVEQERIDYTPHFQFIIMLLVILGILRILEFIYFLYKRQYVNLKKKVNKSRNNNNEQQATQQTA